MAQDERERETKRGKVQELRDRKVELGAASHRTSDPATFNIPSLCI
jgi:hypothetical protein